MASTLARQSIENGTAPSVTLDAVYRVAVDEFVLIYTVSATQYADVFRVPNTDDQEILGLGFGSGEHINVVLGAGSTDLKSQPYVTAASLITD